jgi:hypothetical protein
MVTISLMRWDFLSRVFIIKLLLLDSVFSLCVFAIRIVPCRLGIERRLRYFPEPAFLLKIQKLTLPQALRRIFYSVIVENKVHGLGEETNFDFKYIPNFDTTETEMGEYVAGLKESGVERRNLRTLVIASVCIAVASYIGMRTTWGIVASVRDWWGV